jgi:hypothetical protein
MDRDSREDSKSMIQFRLSRSWSEICANFESKRGRTGRVLFLKTAMKSQAITRSRALAGPAQFADAGRPAITFQRGTADDTRLA